MSEVLFIRRAVLTVALLVGNAEAVTTYTATGADADAIRSTVDDFRDALGAENPNGYCKIGVCTPGIGRREVNWDDVPDSLASPNAFADDFYNYHGVPTERLRGVVFSTTGRLEVSASTTSGVPILFGNHSMENVADFSAYSGEHVLGIVGSNELDVFFGVPGNPSHPGLSRGFGAVFTDVEVPGSVRLDFYNFDENRLIFSMNAPAYTDAGSDSFKSFSFVGAVFDAPAVYRVHIVNGGYDLALVRYGSDDATAMDDFIFGEPLPVPEPATWVSSALGLFVLSAARRLRHPRNLLPTPQGGN